MHDGTLGNFKTSRRERVDIRVNIRVGVERRRRWSREEKLRLVRASLERNAVVADVAQCAPRCATLPPPPQSCTPVHIDDHSKSQHVGTIDGVLHGFDRGSAGGCLSTLVWLPIAAVAVGDLPAPCDEAT